MKKIKTTNGKIVTKNGVPSCECCYDAIGFYLECNPPGPDNPDNDGSNGEGCHDDLSWCIVTDPVAGEIFNDCPGYVLVPVSIIPGTTISVRYSNTLGPCPGGHCCNAATFKLFITNGVSSLFVAHINLNNSLGCGDVTAPLVTITNAHLEALAALP